MMRKPKIAQAASHYPGKVQGLGRPAIMAGLQFWLPQPNHEYASEMSDIPSRITYAYSL